MKLHFPMVFFPHDSFVSMRFHATRSLWRPTISQRVQLNYSLLHSQQIVNWTTFKEQYFQGYTFYSHFQYIYGYIYGWKESHSCLLIANILKDHVLARMEDCCLRFDFCEFPTRERRVSSGSEGGRDVGKARKCLFEKWLKLCWENL